ncbi:hypothetical protein [Streptomyces sp. NPDC057702]|uniref:hypothetical protein n=1 Tax=unclassified Streptomyces TaxID=2593676 RepID=UPI00368A5AA5
MSDQRDLRVSVSHSQYVLFTPDSEPLELTEEMLTSGNGLVALNDASTYASVMTGTSWGNVDLTIHIAREEPPLRGAGWDEIVEVSLHVPDGELSLGDVTADSVEELPLPADHQSLWWRARVHARGRDAAAQRGDVWAEEGDPVPEQHLLCLWPAPPAPEIRHKLTDEVGTHTRT